MEKILISACLLGEKVRYDGDDCKVSSPVLSRWLKEDRLIPFCPEVAGGLGVPRIPAEIQGGEGKDILEGNAFVMNELRQDMTQFFIFGANQTLELTKKHNIRMAILKSLSPSCGIGEIYDGSFTRTIKGGDGVTVALLKRMKIKVYQEYEILKAEKVLLKMEQKDDFRTVD